MAAKIVTTKSGLSANFSGKMLNENIPDTPPPEYESIAAETAKEHLPPSSDEVAVLIPSEFLFSEALDTKKDDCLKSSDEISESTDSDPCAECDPWATPTWKDTSVQWADLSSFRKVKRVVIDWFGKFIVLLALLYVFICSLDFLSSAFRLLGGKAAGEAFSNSVLLQNPVAGLMLGILATVLVQSSSTSTSITVTMVASGILEVKPAIFIIMGANIGTSVTNTFVSMAQSSDRNEFRRAFGAATVHDMFNWLSVIILLPLEVATGYLNKLTTIIVSSYNLQSQKGANKDILKVITKPFTNLIIQLDKKVIERIATGEEKYKTVSLIKKWCKYKNVIVPVNTTAPTNVTVLLQDGGFHTMVKNISMQVNTTEKIGQEKCVFLFSQDTGMGDAATGVILLVISLFILCTCLVLLVKLLHSLMEGKIAVVINKTLNADFPGKLKWLSGYVAIFIGAGMTIVVQSSSVFTSALTPLVGVGIITIERMYPLTLGSNIGTTATGLLAALASPGDKLAPALQIALCHLMFNISGILIFYPIPALRKIPIKLAKKLGNITADYRWFPVVYVILMFLLLPISVFSLSMAGIIPLCVIGVPLVILTTMVVTINILQSKKPKWLPCKLRNWDWLPFCLRSLKPIDHKLQYLRAVFHKCLPCCCKMQKTSSVQEKENQQGQYLAVECR